MNLRARTIIVLTGILLLTVMVVLPRSTEAGRLKWFGAEKTPPAKTAFAMNAGRTLPHQTPDIAVTASPHNATSIPIREMNPQPAFPQPEHAANNNQTV